MTSSRRSLPSRAFSGRWTAEQAWDWHRRLPWLVGCNFIPSTAVNQLEMWQAETFDPKTISRELGWLASLGMNSVRVFLHDLAWEQDWSGFLDRLDRVLGLAHRKGIGLMPVFFDGCWHPFPHPGPQRDPEPGVHNSFWLQSPGAAVVRDPRRFAKLEAYVSGVIGHFRDDPRIHVWDLWNEPEHPNTNNHGIRDIPSGEKADRIAPLLAKAFAWARAAKPTQPLTSGVWNGDAEKDEAGLHDLHRLQLFASDVISFHSYCPVDEVRRIVERFQRLGRPLLCTEYMARNRGSTFQKILPLFQREKIAAYNWGSVAGRSQTFYPWESWQKPSPPEPPLWFHDIFRSDGTPYRQGEATFLRRITKAC